MILEQKRYSLCISNFKKNPLNVSSVANGILSLKAGNTGSAPRSDKKHNTGFEKLKKKRISMNPLSYLLV